MKRIFTYVKTYFLCLPPMAFFTCTFFIAAAIFCNYFFGVNKYINTLDLLPQFIAWYLIFFTVFFFGYFVQAQTAGRKLFQNPMFVRLLCVAPALFAWKMAARFQFQFTADVYQNAYWNHVLYWPAKLIVVAVALLAIWWRFEKAQPFYGTSTKRFAVKPYLLMLVLMLPLLAWASTQKDFLAIYPKLKNIAFLANGGTWYHKLLYELSYGTDFFTIELFFRGFLVLAFARWAGKDAVLPMALFYCTIHFGKPLGECISSFFGGLVLGAVTLNTRSIWGGLIVHLGIAWLMELFGYFHPLSFPLSP